MSLLNRLDHIPAFAHDQGRASGFIPVPLEVGLRDSKGAVRRQMHMQFVVLGALIQLAS